MEENKKNLYNGRKEKDDEALKATGKIIINDRKRIELTNVSEVVRFDEFEIILNTELGGLEIKGENLKMNKLDVQEGDVVIHGLINSFVYTTKSRKKKGGILSKIFK